MVESPDLLDSEIAHRLHLLRVLAAQIALLAELFVVVENWFCGSGLRPYRCLAAAKTIGALVCVRSAAACRHVPSISVPNRPSARICVLCTVSI